jgi:hypothetical protein
MALITSHNPTESANRPSIRIAYVLTFDPPDQLVEKNRPPGAHATPLASAAPAA